MPETQPTQENRKLRLMTPLGEDVLLPVRFNGFEALSSLFHFEIECFSARPDLDPDKIVGANVTVGIRRPDGDERFFNGIVSRFRQLETTLEATRYELEMVPWLWLLDHATNCRIFQEKTAPEIIREIFDEHGQKDHSFKLSGEFLKREYCVQYGESAFSFVCRLMEDEGIHYHFKHENGKHTLVLGDDPSAHPACPGRSELVFNVQREVAGEDEIVYEMSRQHAVRSTRVALKDFNYTDPQAKLAAEREDTAKYGVWEVYHYPGLFPDSGTGNRLAKIRIEELSADRVLVSGRTDCPTLTAGHKFQVREHPHKEFNESFVITRVLHTASEAAGYLPGHDPGVEEHYDNSFQCIPAGTAYRPPRTTVRPRIHGAQTAIVTGPAGEEIHTDKLGRIKVKFHWDRLGKLDDKSSCWVRVSQGWAGKNWGTWYLPRINMEVVVEFLEGDPDRPLVTGCVYNAEAMPPYPLPEHMTVSGVKSRSTKGAQSDNLNVIFLEDKLGEERIYIHAEKDQENRVKNDSVEWIGQDRHLLVKRDQIEKVERDRMDTVIRDHTESVEGSRHLTVGGSQSVSITEKRSTTVEGDVADKFESNRSVEVTGDSYLKAANIVIEADENLTLKVGGSFIAIESSGIKIGTTGEIVLEASGDIGVDGNNVTISASGSAELSASGSTTIQGATVDIN